MNTATEMPAETLTATAENAGMVNAITERAMSEANAPSTGEVELPPLPEVAESIITLPGGLDHPEHGLLETAEVRELTGADEEAIARIPLRDVWKFKSVMLKRGVVSIGDHPYTDALGRFLSIGDREFLLLQIRIATYGPTLEFDARCPSCEAEQSISIDLREDLSLRKSTETGAVRFTLSDGTEVEATVPSVVEDDKSLQMESKGKTGAEINTMMLGACVQSLNGGPWSGEKSALSLGIRTRKELIEKLMAFQPGPDYAKGVKANCASCGEERSLMVSLGDMFRG